MITLGINTLPTFCWCSVTISILMLCNYIDSLVQDYSISSALAMEILQSCTEPAIWRIQGKWTLSQHGGDDRLIWNLPHNCWYERQINCLYQQKNSFSHYSSVVYSFPYLFEHLGAGLPSARTNVFVMWDVEVVTWLVVLQHVEHGHRTLWGDMDTGWINHINSASMMMIKQSKTTSQRMSKLKRQMSVPRHY